MKSARDCKRVPGVGVVRRPLAVSRGWYTLVALELDLSIIAPAHNEQDNVAPLVRAIASAMEPLEMDYEIIIVDDGSTDRTPARLRELLDEYADLRVIRMASAMHGRGNGQSAAFHAGFRAARGRLIATLDADLQNDPADLPRLLDLMHRHEADMVQGNRNGTRADGTIRSFSSWVGRFFRRILLGDTIIDTGCSLRVMKREVALRLPLEFRGMHRFIPITARQMGYIVIEAMVSHRARGSGRAKYGMWNRAIPGLIDCFAMLWMRSRRRPVEFRRIEATRSAESVQERHAFARMHTDARG